LGFTNYRNWPDWKLTNGRKQAKIRVTGPMSARKTSPQMQANQPGGRYLLFGKRLLS
jgi:hypothetical protein